VAPYVVRWNDVYAYSLRSNPSERAGADMPRMRLIGSCVQEALRGAKGRKRIRKSKIGNGEEELGNGVLSKSRFLEWRERGST
jgi:hypothetical protein